MRQKQEIDPGDILLSKNEIRMIFAHFLRNLNGPTIFVGTAIAFILNFLNRYFFPGNQTVGPMDWVLFCLSCIGMIKFIKRWIGEPTPSESQTNRGGANE